MRTIEIIVKEVDGDLKVACHEPNGGHQQFTQAEAICVYLLRHCIAEAINHIGNAMAVNGVDQLSFDNKNSDSAKAAMKAFEKP